MHYRGLQCTGLWFFLITIPLPPSQIFRLWWEFPFLHIPYVICLFGLMLMGKTNDMIVAIIMPIKRNVISVIWCEAWKEGLSLPIIAEFGTRFVIIVWAVLAFHCPLYSSIMKQVHFKQIEIIRSIIFEINYELRLLY